MDRTVDKVAVLNSIFDVPKVSTPLYLRRILKQTHITPSKFLNSHVQPRFNDIDQ